MAPAKDDYRFEHASPTGGIAFHDRKEGDMLKRSLQYLVQRVGRQVMSGSLNVTSLSMPVYLNEPRSLLERITDDWAYAPHFLPAAAATSDPVQRLKLVAAFVVSGLHCVHTLGKPFNPILGSTYQTTLSDGTKCYVEQTSHHPPVTHYYIRPDSAAYTLAGFSGIEARMEWGLDMGLSSRRIGINVVQFADGSRIVYNLPRMLVRGLSTEKKCEFLGPFSLYYERHSLVFDILLNPPQPHRWSPFRAAVPTDYLDGVLYKLTDTSTLHESPLRFSRAFAATATAFFGDPDAASTTADHHLFTPVELRPAADVALSVTAAVHARDGKHAVPGYGARAVIAYARGTFIGYLDIDGKRFWDIRHTPIGDMYAADMDLALRSDCRFREDILALKRAVAEEDDAERERITQDAQTLKEKLENVQRNDKKLRVEGLVSSVDDVPVENGAETSEKLQGAELLGLETPTSANVVDGHVLNNEKLACSDAAPTKVVRNGNVNVAEEDDVLEGNNTHEEVVTHPSFFPKSLGGL